jgi:hypothetical protein
MRINKEITKAKERFGIMPHQTRPASPHQRHGRCGIRGFSRMESATPQHEASRDSADALHSEPKWLIRTRRNVGYELVQQTPAAGTDATGS